MKFILKFNQEWTEYETFEKGIPHGLNGDDDIKNCEENRKEKKIRMTN